MDGMSADSDSVRRPIGVGSLDSELGDDIDHLVELIDDCAGLESIIRGCRPFMLASRSFIFSSVFDDPACEGGFWNHDLNASCGNAHKALFGELEAHK